MLRLLWQTGVRPVEALALRPEDIDISRLPIRIETRGDFRVKTKKSNRTIPVTAERVDALGTQSRLACSTPARR